MGLLLLFSTKTLALNKFSHQLVCQLSFNNLSADKKHDIQQLLKYLPTSQKKVINKYNKQKFTRPITFAQACTWADAIKGQSQYDHFKSWHYLNVPRDTQEIIQLNSTDTNIVFGIKKHRDQLNALSASWEKLQALMFLGHWLGDIHQPLHISFASDRGGNQTKIMGADKCNNLHWYWDECLLKSQKLTFNQQLNLLQSLWDKTRDTEIKNNTIEYTEKNIFRWANESYQLVIKPNFRYCKKFKGECLPLKGTSTLTKEYASQHIQPLNYQLVKAALRLNTLISNIRLK